MELTVRVLEQGGEAPSVEGWTARHRTAVDRVEPLVAELRAQATVDLPMLTVVSRQMRGLTSGV